MRGRARHRCGGHHGDMRTPPPVPEPAATGPVAGVDDVVDAKATLRARLRTCLLYTSDAADE